MMSGGLENSLWQDYKQVTLGLSFNTHNIKNIQTQGRFYISIVLQGFIAEPDRKWTREELPRISEGYTVDDIQSRCIIMNKVSYQ